MVQTEATHKESKKRSADDESSKEKPKAKKPRRDMVETEATHKESKKRSADDKSSEEKPMAKKPRRDSSAKKKSPKNRVSASTEELKSARKTAEKDFETEKARILGEVPEDNKARWGQIGFGKWGKDWLPCLIVGPYDVGPLTSMRESWMKMFENVSVPYPFLVRIFL
jgi:hypothetical protein